MKIIAIVNRKGGVGKTATAQALGAGLLLKGKTVLFIDLDSQTNLTHGLKADQSSANILNVLMGDSSAVAAVQKTDHGDIIAGVEALAGADNLLEGTGKEYRLKEALEGLNYDYCIIDTPAALGTLTINALTAASAAIIPVQAEIYSLQGLTHLEKTIAAVRKYCNQHLEIDGILVTRYNGRAILSKNLLETLQGIAEKLNTRVYASQIRECISIKEAQAMQQDIFSYAPKSNAARDYETFIQEFLKER